jgi:hypothetical protein
MGSYNPQNFNNYFEQVKRSNTDIDHYTGVGDYDYNQEAVGNYGQDQSMGMYSVTQNINIGDHQATMYEQPLSQQEMQQRLNAYNQQSIYFPGSLHQPNQQIQQMQHMQQMQQPIQQPQQMQPMQQQHRAYYNESWQSMPAQNNHDSELLYQISENQHHILKELKQNKQALSNPELVNKINEISRKQEQLLKQRFN